MQIMWFSVQFVVGNANYVVSCSVCGWQCKLCGFGCVKWGGCRGGLAPPGGLRGAEPPLRLRIREAVTVY